VLESLARFRRFFRKLLEVLALALMTALALVVVAGIVFRKAGASLVWYDEIASILLVWLTYYGSCLAALDRAHIGFPRLVESTSGPLRRFLQVIREGVVIGFFLMVAWTGWVVLGVLGGTYLVSLPWLPALVTQSVIPIGAVLFILAEVLSLIDVSTVADADPGEAEPS
jgi:TRAP-type C4-dicarboxylate transport system permease small subunit